MARKMENLISSIRTKLMRFIIIHFKKVMKQLYFYVWSNCIIRILKKFGIWKKIINLIKIIYWMLFYLGIIKIIN